MFAYLNISKAQTENNNITSSNKWSIVGSFGSQKWLFPSESQFKIKSLTPIHKITLRPRVALGIERTWRQNKNVRFYQDLKISYCNDTYVENQFGIQTTLGWEIKVFKGLKINPAIELGYMNAKRSDVVYQYTDSKWTPISNPGASANRLSFAFAPSISHSITSTIDIIALMRLTIVSPYITDIPLFLFKEPALGLRYRL